MMNVSIKFKSGEKLDILFDAEGKEFKECMLNLFADNKRYWLANNTIINLHEIEYAKEVKE
jgi:hypothetical protein